MRIVGIDPGLSGAIAVIDERYRFQGCADMPIMGKGGKSKRNEVNGAEVASILRQMDPDLVVLERVNAVTRPGQQPQGVASMFSFGDSFGCVRGVAHALGLSIVMMTPPQWKRKAGLLGKDKEASRAKAIQLWPTAPLSRKKDHARAEALLIARFGCVDHINHPMRGNENAVDQLTCRQAGLRV